MDKKKTQRLKESSFRVSQARPMNSLPYDVVKAIELVNMNPKYPPLIVGSYKYMVHEYPNDVDLFEFQRGEDDYETTLKYSVKRLKEIVAAIDTTPNMWLGDLKLGKDVRYKINIGELKGNELIDYDAPRIRSEVRRLYDEKLLTKSELKEWLRLVADSPSLVDFTTLKDTIHERSVYRWTVKDISNGYKTLEKGATITMEGAFSQQGVVKIDVWCYIAGRFTEVTNWYAIRYLNSENGKEEYMTEPLTAYESSLTRDIKMYMNPLLHKAMKLSKRYWNYITMKGMQKEMLSLYPLFSSPAAKMYQIMGEIEVISKMLAHLKRSELDMTLIRQNIESWKLRLGTVLSDSLPLHTAERTFERIDKCLSTKSKDTIITTLDNIYEDLEINVDANVRRYFKQHHIDVTIAFN